MLSPRSSLALFGSALFLLPLAACGGGSGDSSGSTSTNNIPNNPPPISQAPVFSSAPSVSVDENSDIAFYTVAVSDPDSAASPMVSLSSSGDGQYFELDGLTLTISAQSGLDFELPVDADGDNVYELSLQASDSDGQTTSFNLAVDVSNVADNQSFNLSPDVAPSENFDLADWKIDVPFNAQGGFDGIQVGVEDFEIDGYEHPVFFYTGPDGGLVMRSPVIGATTSTGATFTRTELREMLRRGNRSISTRGSGDRPNLNNWAFSSQPQSAQDTAGGVDGRLRVSMAVNMVTTTGQNNQIGRVIIGQIHAKDDEPARLYYRKLPGNTHGSIYVQHEIAGGDDINFDMIGGVSSSISNPSDGFLLGEIFTYEIIARGNFLDIIILQDDVVLAEQTIDMTNSGYDVDDDFMYFKAGNYHVNNTAEPEEYSEVTIYELRNSHEGYAFSED